MKFGIAAILTGMIMTSAMAGSALDVGTGISGDADGAKAGLAAAKNAKAGIGKAAPKLVLVFAGRKQLTPAMIDAVATVFDKKLIYGCESYSPLTNETNFHDQKHNADGVAVLALGGDIAVTVASAKTPTKESGGRVKAGEAIGAKLKAAALAAKDGKFLLTFGDQHVGKDNKDLVQGMQNKLGKKLLMVGAAAGGGNAKEIVAGKIVTGTNIGILITGAFKTSAAMSGDKKDFAETCKKVMTKAVGDKKDKVKLAFVFDCGGRRGGMIGKKTIKKEFDYMKASLGKAPFFGFYGGGEVGAKDNKSPSEGVGYSIATAVILAK
jgi:hypothetical protein